MSSPDSHASWRREHDARGRLHALVRPARPLVQPAGPAGDRRAGIAPRRPRGETRDPGLHHPQRQARRLLRGRRPPRDRRMPDRGRCRAPAPARAHGHQPAGERRDPHCGRHPWRLPGRRPGAGAGLPASRRDRLGGTPASRAAGDPPRPGPRLGRHHPAAPHHRSRGGAQPAAHRPVDRVPPRTVPRPGRPAHLRGRPGNRRSIRARRQPPLRGGTPANRGRTSSSGPATAWTTSPARSPRSRSASSPSSRSKSSTARKQRKKRPSRRSPSSRCPPRPASRSPGSSSASVFLPCIDLMNALQWTGRGRDRVRRSTRRPRGPD